MTAMWAYLCNMQLSDLVWFFGEDTQTSPRRNVYHPSLGGTAARSRKMKDSSRYEWLQAKCRVADKKYLHICRRSGVRALLPSRECSNPSNLDCRRLSTKQRSPWAIWTMTTTQNQNPQFWLFRFDSHMYISESTCIESRHMLCVFLFYRGISVSHIGKWDDGVVVPRSIGHR